MAFPGNGVRIVLEGTMPGNERFATGFFRENIDSGTSMQSAVDSFVAGSSFADVVTALKPFMNTGTTLTTLRGYRYGAGRAATDVGAAAVAGGVGTGTGPHPNQVAMCLTLRTATAGRRGRGRMYLPANGIPLANPTGFASNAQITPLLTALAVFLDAQNAEVWSDADTAKRRVTRIEMDTRPDVLRRRADAMTGIRYGQNIANPN